MMKKKVRKGIDRSWIKCPDCGSRNYYWRLEANDAVCRKCGTIFGVTFQKRKTYIITCSGELLSKPDSKRSA